MRPPVDLVPLELAVLCEACQRISAATNGHCIGCGSAALLNLANVLNRLPNRNPPFHRAESIKSVRPDRLDRGNGERRRR